MFRAYPVDAQWATRTRLSSTGRRALCAIHRNGPYSSPFYLSARTDDGNMVFRYPQSIGGDCRNGEKQNSRWLSSIGHQPDKHVMFEKITNSSGDCAVGFINAVCGAMFATAAISDLSTYNDNLIIAVFLSYCFCRTDWDWSHLTLHDNGNSVPSSAHARALCSGLARLLRELCRRNQGRNAPTADPAA
jgi:hypothetical protein